MGDRTDMDDNQAGARDARRARSVANLPQAEVVRDEVMELMQSRFAEFLQEFSSAAEGDGETEISQTGGSGRTTQYRDYVMQANNMVENDTTTLYVDWKHLLDFDAELAEVIELEYFRFEPCLCDAVREFIGRHFSDYIWNTEDAGRGEKKSFFISFYDLPCVERIRALRTDRIGRLLSVSGTVTRTSEVRPELLAGYFTCGKCGKAEPSVAQQYQYTKPPYCRNPACNNPNDFELDMDKSRFVDWQRVKVQENADEIPAGSMPRSIDVILRHEVVEKAKAGDKSVFTGMLVVIPDHGSMARAGEATVAARGDANAGVRAKDQGPGFRGLKKLGVKELTYRTCFMASGVQPLEVRTGVHNVRDAPDGPDNLASEFTQEERDEILRMSQTPNLYQKMVESVAPSVFGHQWVKRGVLLMLLGGVHKRTPEGIKLRGDINTCIVGDPSTAKSQFLKYVHGFLPRAVYTSGKASSAAGLTASVGKDPETGEFCVDAGALMLADNGICCIDEFDKMDAADQVAIHEAMEQQTISITKAGIQATLNARTSILAAANPRGGRYDRSKSLRANVDLSAPIMSRFDLFFVVLDECDEASDLHIAQHILDCHRQKLEVLAPPYTTDELQRYIRYARAFDPQISPSGAQELVDCYRQLRQQDTLGRNRSCYRITVRQLESLVRLSEALARLHLDDEVKPVYVREAHRLLKTSIIHVDADDVVLDYDEEEEDGPGDGGGGANLSGGLGAEDDDDDDLEAYAGMLPSASDSTKAARKVQSISNEKFKEISSMIGRHLNQLDERSGGSGSGVQWDQVVTWYLEQRVDDIGSEEEFDNEKEVVNKVIRRLLGNTLILIGMPEAEIPEEDQMIALHPNVDIRSL